MKRALCVRCGLDLHTLIRRDATIYCYPCMVAEAEGQCDQDSTLVPYTNPLAPEPANPANNIDKNYLVQRSRYDV